MNFIFVAKKMLIITQSPIWSLLALQMELDNFNLFTDSHVPRWCIMPARKRATSQSCRGPQCYSTASQLQFCSTQQYLSLAACDLPTGSSSSTSQAAGMWCLQYIRIVGNSLLMMVNIRIRQVLEFLFKTTWMFYLPSSVYDVYIGTVVKLRK